MPVISVSWFCDHLMLSGLRFTDGYLKFHLIAWFVCVAKWFLCQCFCLAVGPAVVIQSSIKVKLFECCSFTSYWLIHSLCEMCICVCFRPPTFYFCNCFEITWTNKTFYFPFSLVIQPEKRIITDYYPLTNSKLNWILLNISIPHCFYQFSRRSRRKKERSKIGHSLSGLTDSAPLEGEEGLGLGPAAGFTLSFEQE